MNLTIFERDKILEKLGWIPTRRDMESNCYYNEEEDFERCFNAFDVEGLIREFGRLKYNSGLIHGKLKVQNEIKRALEL